MKRKNIITFAIASIVAFSTAAFMLTANGGRLFNVHADERDDLTLTLDVSNRVTDASWAHTTRTYGAYTTVEYNDANSNEAFHVQLGGNGYMFKQEASKSIKTIRVTKENNGTLLIESDYVPTFNSNARFEEWMTGTDETFHVCGNYWRIKNVSGGSTSVCIGSVIVTYDCYDEDTQTADSNASISRFIDFDSRYTIQDVDGTTYYTMRGYSDYHLVPSQLYIVDDSNNVIDCSMIRYRRDSRFELFFDLDTFYSTHTSYNGDFNVHLFVNGAKWNGDSSDVFARDNESNYSYPFATPAGGVRLVNASWKKESPYACAIRFENNNPIASNITFEGVGDATYLVFTGTGISEDKLNNLGFDVEPHDDWQKIYFTGDSVTRTFTAGTWTIKANISSIKEITQGFGIHLLYGDTSIDMIQKDYTLTSFTTSYYAAYKLARTDWFDGSGYIGLFTGYEYECWWTVDWVFNDQANVIIWAWGGDVDAAWYDMMYVDYQHIRVILPSYRTGFKLARFSNGTTAANANWNNVINQTNDATIVSGTWAYQFNW